MALLDFMKEGFNTLQSQPQMYDPHANARRLMGGAVQAQQDGGTGFGSLLGDGTGFNFFGSDNISENAQEPLPRMDVRGQVGGQNFTPYQGQEIAPSHLGAVTQDFSEQISVPLPAPGTHNTYSPYEKDEFGRYKREVNNFEPGASQTGRERTRFGDEVRYTTDASGNSVPLTEQNSPAKVALNELDGGDFPSYNLSPSINTDKDGNSIVAPGDKTIYDFDEANFSGTEQIVGYNEPTNTTLFPDILGTPGKGTEQEIKAKKVKDRVNNKSNTTYDENKKLEQLDVVNYPNTKPEVPLTQAQQAWQRLRDQKAKQLRGIRDNPFTSREEQAVFLEKYNIDPSTYLIDPTRAPGLLTDPTNPRNEPQELPTEAVVQNNTVVTPKEVDELSITPKQRFRYSQIMNNPYYSDARKIELLKQMNIPIPDSLGK